MATSTPSSISAASLTSACPSSAPPPRRRCCCASRRERIYAARRSARYAARVKLTVRPVAPELWPALEDLFGPRGACNGCWCMYWRLGPAYFRRPHERNRRDLAARVRAGPPPGLLAFDGDLAVGWCQLTPRDELPWLERNRMLGRVDDAPVW